MSEKRNKEIAVSIDCCTFNHAKYIRKTLDGFLSQKTNFYFEILIHDDASTDNTQAIIREYEKKYPHIIKPIYQTENQYGKGLRPGMAYNLPRAKGKYVAYCEGDDFWCDENKLQRQYDAMEKHPECSMCVHMVKVVSEDEREEKGTIPLQPYTTEVIEEEIFLRHELIGGWAAQTSSYFIRNECVKRYIDETPAFSRFMAVGDLPTVLYVLTRGKICFINEIMSCYRFGGVGSFRERRTKDRVLDFRYISSLIIGLNEYNKYTNYKYDQLIRTCLSMRIEQMEPIIKMLKKECEQSYLNEIYRGRDKELRMQVSYIVRRRFPFIYNMLLVIYKKVKGLS